MSHAGKQDRATVDGNSASEPSRYVVGIDLGTTNSAAAYVDTKESPWRPRTLSVEQIVAPGEIEARETIPSFHYQAAPGEFPPSALAVRGDEPDADHVVGVFARDHGMQVPGRLIASAKSWLCHTGVDRTAPLLPWHGATDVQRLSPVEVSTRYLGRIRATWDAQFPGFPLAEQDIVLTLPASFDEIARELTVKAAASAGLPRVVLIEEPQAAFYAWIHAHQGHWEEHVRPGDKILVCDVGGGTSDFTLIRARRGEEEKIRFHRVAVGEHLILGGDNLDLALAHHLEAKLPGPKLEPRQWSTLLRRCRHVKETLLADDAPRSYTVSIDSGGSRLIGGALQSEVSRDEVHDLLLEGFLPRVALEDQPATHRSGFQEFGLPFAPDAAITRYLGAFLVAHRLVALEEGAVTPGVDSARPDVVLFNGGLFESSVLRERMIEVLTGWFRNETSVDWRPVLLHNERLDLAVARGAAYFGMVRRGQGERIAASLARSYYIGIQSDPPRAVCLVPGGTEAGQDVEIADRPFDLLVSEPVEFPLYVSSTRLTDAPGDVIEVDPQQMTRLPPLRTVLRSRDKGNDQRVAIRLHARLTEIGTLDIWCSESDGPRSWRLQFDVRSTTETDREAHDPAAQQAGILDEVLWEGCLAAIQDTFGPDATEKPSQLVRRLGTVTQLSRGEWPASLLRRIWDALLDVESARRKSQAHESRWLNLVGYCLRPGYGLAADDWRVAETWRLVQGKLVHASLASRNESWILWRRIAGGLTTGQQRAVADPLLATVRSMHRRATTGKGRSSDVVFSPEESIEVWRLLGSLELLETRLKLDLGKILLDLLPRRKMLPARAAMIWALGRLGSRRPVYGPLNVVVPSEVAGRWLEALLGLNVDEPANQLAVMQLARRTDDRYRDLPDAIRNEAADWLSGQSAPGHLAELVTQGGSLDHEEQQNVFGESLPQGLRIL